MCFMLLGEAGAWFEVRVEARVTSCSASSCCQLHPTCAVVHLYPCNACGMLCSDCLQQALAVRVVPLLPYSTTETTLYATNCHDVSTGDHPRKCYREGLAFAPQQRINAHMQKALLARNTAPAAHSHRCTPLPSNSRRYPHSNQCS